MTGYESLKIFLSFLSFSKKKVEMVSVSSQMVALQKICVYLDA